ncbi:MULTISPECIES: putative DNA modification/repair radical SAM protein [Thermoanaerobacterium]|uniref:Radical SAM protein n=2 Tax=Thermoanaerobacterium TaxID=28895 RepID=W9E7P5_9THEO|nr:MULTISPECIES: putative DNA modification/repair radical SAM protein [Thermoanaerobacterium]AFK87658.1 Radical SAM domain protein [Thermoanaerobacterium saccharolyticum JW/SL-YS485]ETO37593.1 radical SAM protein [Thermoanaerobacterium aotearoense SCUT27]
MDLLKKIRILADAAKYDVSCSSSGSDRENKNSGIGNASFYGICHSWSEDGRCISLLKILFTNICIYNCSYCVNRCSNDVERALFTPEELADITINFYRRNYIEGLFLSSAVYKSPDYTMELLIKTVKKLREEYNFNGYIHLKAIPGADVNLIRLAGLYADRMSVNIELPSEKSLKLLAPQKTKESIIKPMSFIHNQLMEKSESKKLMRRTDKFVPAGQTTQLIIGATPESDRTILKLSENLYKYYDLKRVYYSAYIPVFNDNNILGMTSPPLLREHRLYQADWLLRYYNFKADELLTEEEPNFDVSLDPKINWAMKNLNLFPVEVNTADYNMLLRVPGIGLRTANRIVKARKAAYLNYDSLKKLGVVLKRAKYFITCNGKYYGECEIETDKIKNKLLPKRNVIEGQLSIFDIDNTLNNLPIIV